MVPVRKRANGVTLTEHAATWISQHPGSDSTVAHYRSALDRHVMPAIGGLPLARVTHDDIRTLLLETLPAKPVGRSVIITVRTLLTGVFGAALKSHKVSANPPRASGSLRAAIERAEFEMVDWKHAGKVAEAMKDNAVVILMRGCAAFASARRWRCARTQCAATSCASRSRYSAPGTALARSAARSSTAGLASTAMSRCRHTSRRPSRTTWPCTGRATCSRPTPRAPGAPGIA